MVFLSATVVNQLPECCECVLAMFKSYSPCGGQENNIVCTFINLMSVATFRHNAVYNTVVYCGE